MFKAIHRFALILVKVIFIVTMLPASIFILVEYKFGAFYTTQSMLACGGIAVSIILFKEFFAWLKSRKEQKESASVVIEIK